MAPNGTSRKTPVPPSKPSTNLIPKPLLDTLLPSTTSKLKLRTPVPALAKPPKPGSWDIGSTLPPAPAAPITAPSSPIALSFSHGHPLSDRADVIKCNHCKRAILRHRAKSHIESCIAKKQEKQRKKKEAKDARDAAARKAERGGVSSESSSEDEEEGKQGPGGAAAKKTSKTTAAGQAGKKRKMTAAAGEEEGPKKKKKKEEVKAKVKVKAPVDVERQCGVELPQGGQCARSLTCKSHSMGAKRAVPGRSAPYDKLLAEYQRKNQAKLQKAALDAQALPEDAAPEGPVDSDEEKDQILAAIGRSHPRPLFQPQLVPLRRKYNYVRLKEMLGNALGGRGGGLFSSGGQGAGGAFGGMNGMNGLGSAGGMGGGQMSAGGMRGSIDQGRRESMAESVREGSVSATPRETPVQG
ncbi:zinc-binding domain-containing protein [Elsinoe australis]|uniref:Zinc-binding domain-containing protein n=1 Tax=Elsinoe australis TaxID=40998 RepID=A0A4U7ALR2_9PEZI|nr:zinc-binding domain-containing protein [Elsinoe australis]